jgi:hypothetical protein
MEAFSIMMLLSAAMPEEMIVSKLNEVTQHLLIFPDDKEKKDELKMLCMMFHLNQDSGGNIEKAHDKIKEVEDRERKLSILDINDLMN